MDTTKQQAMAWRLAHQYAPFADATYHIDRADLAQEAMLAIAEHTTAAHNSQFWWARGRILHALRSAVRAARYRYVDFVEQPKLAWCQGWQPLTPEEATSRKEQYEQARAIVGSDDLWRALEATLKHASQKGETLADIAQRYDITPQAMWARAKTAQRRLRRAGLWHAATRGKSP